MKKYDIVCVGSAVIDAFVETGISEVHKKMCYDVGTKIAVEDLQFRTGGGGTNTAVAFSRLGLKSAYVGKIGMDANAEIILGELKKEKVDFLGARGKDKTGFSIVLDSSEHNRTILTYKGANDTLLLKELNFKNWNSDWFYFSSFGGVAFSAEEKLIEHCKKNGATIAYNPSSYVTRKGISHVRKILKNTDILILNDEEARDLIPKGDVFDGLHSHGSKIVCVTRGKNGSEVSDGNSRVKIAAARNSKVVEATGAGDAYASGFIFGMMKFGDLKKAAQCGDANAQSVIMHRGAKVGLLTKSQLLRKINGYN